MNRRWIPSVLHVLIVIALPLAMFASSLRVTTNPWLVHWEYGKADFPVDPFGLPTEERIRLAKICVDYLISGAGIDLLGDLELADGQPAFNERELEHMIDVKRVLWWLLGAGAAAWLTVIASTAALASRQSTRHRAPVALLGGSLLTLGLLAAVGGSMLLAWGTFFTTFHQILFPPGTWTFPYSDTLIRLYPQRFWMDVGIAIVASLAGQALLIGGAALVWMRRQGE